MATEERSGEYTYKANTSEPGTGRTERLEVRLDEPRRHMLAEIAATYEVGQSEMVRRMIDGAYEEILLERRRAALQRIIAAQRDGEEMPDPDELSRQLAATHEVRLEE